jgi:methyl-accepting chemotaxis protein-1 (serine sensor receptor)
MKLSHKLPIGFAAVTLVVACAGLFGMSRMNHALDTYNAAMAQSGQARLMETLLSDFRLQIQDWKSTLLHGKDAEQRTKYWNAFQESEADVAKEAKALVAALPPGETRELLTRFAQAHARMGEGYRRGYADFTSAGFDPVAGYQAVKGMDGAPVELLAQAQQAMTKQTAATVQDAEAVRKYDTMLSYALMLLGAVTAVVAGVLVSRSITRPLGAAVEAAQSVAAGDLRASIEVRGNDETGQLLQALKDMTGSLQSIVSQVRGGAETIAVASDEIARGNIDLSSRTEQQAGAIEETASSMEQMTATVQRNAENAQQASMYAISACDVATKGGRMVDQVVGTMGSISESSRKIVDIISVIDGIAFQTNILALNAAVEAARAGEQGRGFAVVAGEVRNLAHRSASAAKEIKELINDSVARVETGNQLVGEAGATMGEIVTSVRRVMDIIAEISQASAEQGAGIAQINMAVGEMDTSTQQNAALVEEAAAAAEALREQTAALNQVVSVFRLEDARDVRKEGRAIASRAPARLAA